MSSWLMTSVWLAATLLACNPYNPDLGQEPFRCGTSEPRCPDGYRCDERSESQHICVPDSGNVPIRVDAAPVTPDAVPFVCNNDGAIDDNNTIETATTTPIPDFRDDYQLLRLSICPTTDIDIFSFRIDQSGKDLRVDIEFNADRGDLLIDVLNSSGQAITSGTVADGNPDIRRAQVTNMAADVYYARVSATPGVENNYSIFILTTAP